MGLAARTALASLAGVGGELACRAVSQAWVRAPVACSRLTRTAVPPGRKGTQQARVLRGSWPWG